jgi:hypothetical protein
VVNRKREIQTGSAEGDYHTLTIAVHSDQVSLDDWDDVYLTYHEELDIALTELKRRLQERLTGQ